MHDCQKEITNQPKLPDKKMIPNKPRFLKILLVALATSPIVFGLASNVSAAGTKDGYSCDITPHSYNGFVPKQMNLRFVEGDTKVVVWDSFMARYEVDAKTVTVKSNKAGNQRFRWSMLVKTTDGHPLNVSYRVDFDSKTHSGVIKANVAGSSGRSNGGALACKAANLK